MYVCMYVCVLVVVAAPKKNGPSGPSPGCYDSRTNVAGCLAAAAISDDERRC